MTHDWSEHFLVAQAAMKAAYAALTAHHDPDACVHLQLAITALRMVQDCATNARKA